MLEELWIIPQTHSLLKCQIGFDLEKEYFYPRVLNFI